MKLSCLISLNQSTTKYIPNPQVFLWKRSLKYKGFKRLQIEMKENNKEFNWQFCFIQVFLSNKVSNS